MDKITVGFQVKQAGEEEDGFFHIRGLASTYEIDLGDDEIMPGAFADTILNAKNKAHNIDGTKFKALLPSLWQHRTSEPIGSYVEMAETPAGLEVHSIHPLDDTFVSGRVKPQVKVGSVSKMSIGYRAKDYSFREESGRRIRTLEKIDLGEISLVTFPMNTGASITSAKTAISDLPDTLDDLFIFTAKSIGVYGNEQETLSDELKVAINDRFKKENRSEIIDGENLIIDKITVKELTERQLECIMSSKNAMLTKQASKTLISYLNFSGMRDAVKEKERDAQKDSEIKEKLDKLKQLMETN
jgi:HK97 family phage prohead protease